MGHLLTTLQLPLRLRTVGVGMCLVVAALIFFGGNLFDNLRDAATNPAVLFSGTNQIPSVSKISGCVFFDQCRNASDRNNLQIYCRDNSRMCRTFRGGNKEIICDQSEICRNLLLGASADLDSASLLLNSYFVGLCIAVGYFLKLIFEGKATPDLIQLAAIAGFVFAAYCEISFAYWLHYSLATQLGGSVRYPSAVPGESLVQCQAGADAMAAFAALAVFISMATLRNVGGKTNETTNAAN